MDRGGLFAVAALGAAMTLTGCAVGETEMCVSWVSFETPADAAESADAVVIATVVERDGTERTAGVDAHAWTVEVSDWLVGSGADTIRVVSTPVTCTGGGDAYPDGDPLDTDRELLLLLNRDTYTGSGELQLITPLQGAVPAPPGGGMPAAWPEP